MEKSNITKLNVIYVCYGTMTTQKIGPSDNWANQLLMHMCFNVISGYTFQTRLQRCYFLSNYARREPYIEEENRMLQFVLLLRVLLFAATRMLH